MKFKTKYFLARLGIFVFLAVLAYSVCATLYVTIGRTF